MGLAHGRTVTIVRGSTDGYDEYGDPSSGSVSRTVVRGCAVAPRSSSEPDARGRRGVVVGLTLFAPHGTDIRFTDTVEVDGTAYEVEGEPGVWVSPFTGWSPGVEVALSRAGG